MLKEDRLDQIGIAGFGARATAIASRLAAAHEAGRIIVHGIALTEGPAAAAPARRRPARIERAANLFDLAHECALVITAYETHAELIEALAGTAERPGLAGALVPGSLIADFTPAAPHELRRITGQLGLHAVGFIECAIARPVHDDESEKVIYAGGYDEHIERIAPILVRLGSAVQRSGAQGTARTAAAYLDLGRLMNGLAHQDWSALASSAANADRPAANAVMDRAALHAELRATLAFLRSAALAQGADVPFFDTLAKALASGGPEA